MSGAEPFLRRWTRLKAGSADPGPAAGALPERQSQQAATAPGEETAAELPAPETLTADSDFTPFLAPRVSQALHSAALRQLWTKDPVLGAIDPLDIYTQDYHALPVQAALTLAQRTGEELLEEFSCDQPSIASDSVPEHPKEPYESDKAQS